MKYGAHWRKNIYLTGTYQNNSYLEQGGYWQRQAHIYKHPFYYIDYTLAQICAFQFWIKSNENRSVAIQDYIRLCREGGSKSFLELVKIAKLKSPFEEETLTETVAAVRNWVSEMMMLVRINFDLDLKYWRNK